jgi:hypothetical protein
MYSIEQHDQEDANIAVYQEDNSRRRTNEHRIIGLLFSPQSTQALA